MKRIVYMLIILGIFTLNVFSQESNAVPKKTGLVPPYISIFQSFEGLTFLGGGYKSHTGFLTTTYLDLTLGKRVFFDMPIGFSMYPGGDNSLWGYSYGLGVGFYMLNMRNDEGKGNSLKMSFIYSGKFLLDSSQEEFAKSFLLMLGGQVFLTYQKHFDENLALRVGLIFGVHAVEQNNPVALNYGVSVGLAF